MEILFHFLVLTKENSAGYFIDEFSERFFFKNHAFSKQYITLEPEWMTLVPRFINILQDTNEIPEVEMVLKMYRAFLEKSLKYSVQHFEDKMEQILSIIPTFEDDLTNIKVLIDQTRSDKEFYIQLLKAAVEFLAKYLALSKVDQFRLINIPNWSELRSFIGVQGFNCPNERV